MLRFRSSLWTAALATCCLLASATVSLAQSKCVIDYKTLRVCGGSAELCGPEGYEYAWTGPGGFSSNERCIQAGATGTYELTITDPADKSTEKCAVEVTVTDLPPNTITGPSEGCIGDKVTLCGPEGNWEYEWFDDNGPIGTGRCIEVTATSSVRLEVIDPATRCRNIGYAKVDFKECEKPGENCPRTIGFWGQQCPSVTNGARKFSDAQMAQLTACVDSKSAAFSWTNDWQSFCATLNPTTTNHRTQAKRQFAGLLANVCAGELELVANNGETVTLDLATEFTCGGQTTTIGAFIAFADAELVALESASMPFSNTVKARYNKIISCADALNNGVGIGTLCRELIKDDTAIGASAPVMGEMGADAVFGRPSPNPFRDNTSLRYSVTDPAGADVEIAVYDLTGRRMVTLEQGFRSAGVYSARWDGRDASGRTAGAGVYFVRGRIGEQSVGQRVMVVK